MEKNVYYRPLPPSITNSVTIVIAARNEADNLRPFFFDLEKAFIDLRLTFPVLVINDGSTDHSLPILEELKTKYDFLKVIHHPQSKGLTHVLQTAVNESDTDWIYLSPADLESNPSSDLPLLYHACDQRIDAVAGWRQNRKDGKVFASKVANLTCRLLFGLRINDMNWIKLVRRDLLANLPLERVTHAYFLAVLAKFGYQITEVPTPWYPRKSGKSKFGVKRLLPAALKVLQLWWWVKTHPKFLADSV
jgi:glycosyltransferase involved in cell wall biosynthesis